MENEPLLGLATTQELLEELKTRFLISKMAKETGASIAYNRIRTILELTPKELLDYKSVGSL
jgi:hypothetical protein